MPRKNAPKPYREKTIEVPRFKEENGFYTTPKRSKIMSKIRAKETKPEKKLRRALWKTGVRYRKNVRKLMGTPDIVISRYKLAIFIDGEFWHGYDWENKKEQIKSNRGFWVPKIERNMQRDRQTNATLRAQGWTVMRFWERQIKKEFGACFKQILDHIGWMEKHDL